MNIPIIILSFNRPNYLSEVLQSLRLQEEVDWSGISVHLFQDGEVNKFSGRTKAEKSSVDECCRLFKDNFPEGTVHRSKDNIGIALNFARAENFAFEEINSEFAIFLEDDLILSPFYIKTMLKLYALIKDRDDVGYFAAYGVHRASNADHLRFHNDLVALEHNWAFGLTKRQWSKSRPYIDQYLNLVKDVDYTERPHEKIRQLFASWGGAMAGSSQDVAKTLACYFTGSTKINTFAAFAKYIGETGVHFTPQHFKALGYDRSEFLTQDVFTRTSISDSEVEQFRDALKSFATAGLSRPPTTVHARRLASSLFGRDPYDGFEPTISAPILHGWNGDHKSLVEAVRSRKPKVIFDVGVWLGQSTATLAKAQIHAQFDGTVIAIDPFLGSPQHWSPARADVHDLLNFKHGRPNFYETFLSNMVLLGLRERVFPLAQTTTNAAAILAKHEIRADLIHLDAHSTYSDVLRDIETYWDLLEPGGLMIGDDFQFPGVSRAVVHFSDRIGVSYSVSFPKWQMVKPSL